MKLALSALFAATCSVQGFTPLRSTPSFSRTATTSYNWQLNDLIKASDVDFHFDEGQGGVRLTQESAIKLFGSIQHGPGNASPDVENMLRYTKVVEVPDSVVQNTMNTVGAKCVATGIGKELFKDPGETTVKEVTLAPDDAVRDALMGAGSVSESSELIVNFLGGQDLMLDQVLEASKELVLDLSPPTRAKVSFNSLSHKSFPKESATVTVISKNTKETEEEDEGTGGMKGVEKCVANGEVYFRDGKWWTVVEDDINTAIA